MPDAIIVRTVEASRVSHLHRTTKDELRRLAGLLNEELARPDPEAATPVPAADAVAVESPGNTGSPGTVASNP